MPAPAPVESPVVVATKVPRGLEGIKPAELKAHLESGKTKAAQLSRVASSSDKIQGQLGELVTGAATKVEQTHVDAGKRFVEVHAQRAIRDKEISDAKKEKRALGQKEGRLKKTVAQIERVKADKVDIQPESKSGFEAEAVKLESTVRSSIEKTNSEKVAAGEKEATARSEKKALGYGHALRSEWGKIPDNIRAKISKGNLDGAMRVVEETSESLPTFYAGQEILTLRVKEHAKPGQPIEDAFNESAKALDKAIKATRKEELRLARKIDKTIKDPALKTGRLTDTVRGAHVAEDLAVQTEAQRIVQEMYDGAEISAENQGNLKTAVDAAANRVRGLIEKPGFGKKALDSSLLTTEALNEARESKQILDPLRRAVYNGLSGKQKSVEEVLGCDITVVPDDKGRLIEIKLHGEKAKKTAGKSKKGAVNSFDEEKGWFYDRTTDVETDTGQGQPGETKLFARLVQIEHAEDGLSKRLAEADAGDLLAVRTLSEALKTVGKERAKLLKLADARINSVTTADGVRSGAIKTRLGETTVKGVEAAGAAGITAVIAANGTPETFFGLFKLPHIEGIQDHISNARGIVEVANQTMVPFREAVANATGKIQEIKEFIAGAPAQLKALTEALSNISFSGVSLTDADTAIKSGASVTEVTSKLKPVFDVLNQFNNINGQMATINTQLAAAPQQIAELQVSSTQATSEVAKIVNGALTGTGGEQVEAMKDLVMGGAGVAISAASFSDVVRNAAGAPGRALKKLFNRF